MNVRFAVCALALLVACEPEHGAPMLPAIAALSPPDVRQNAPSYSPDGKRMAYWMSAQDSTANWELWVANADLTAPVRLPVTAGFANPPVWSPDGTQLAVETTLYGVGDVAVVPAAGGEAKRLTRGAGFEAPNVWYADGDRLSYYGTAAGGTVNSFVVSLKSGVSTPLVPGEKRPTLGAPSPDGSHVAYFVIEGAKATIWVADSTGGNPRQLTTEGFESLVQNHEWSPDGKSLLYESRRTGTSDLWIAPIDGGKARQLTHDVRNDWAGVWSPDGKWVVFLSDRGRQTDLWMVPAAGGEERRLTDDAAEEQPTLMWRPGTNAVTYVTTQSKSGVWALDLADGKERRLTPDSVRTSYFNIAPDGSQIDYVIPRGGGIEDLAIVPLAGGPARMLLQGGGTVHSPLWSPDSRKIVFESDRGGTQDIWMVDAAGGPPRQLQNWPGYENTAVWSGDGSAVYFISDRDSRLGDLWKVPASGGEPVRITHDGSLGFILSRTGVADVFVGTIGTRGGELGVARVGADGRVQVVWDQTSVDVTSMSPRGDSLAVFLEQPDGKPRSMIISARTGTGRLILKPNDEVGNWSNDGKWLLYLTHRAGATDYGIFNVADGTTRRLTTTKEDENGAEFTPDGKTVVFRRTKTVQRMFSVDISKVLTGGK